MTNILAQTLEKMYTSFENAAENFSKDFTQSASFERDIRKAALEAAAGYYAAYYEEMDEQIRKTCLRSGKYTIQRKRSRTLTTTVGTVTFERTLFYDLDTKKYRYLLDDMLHLPEHERLSEQAEAEILTEAAKSSYSKAGRVLGEANVISKTAVMAKVHEIASVLPLAEAEKKKVCEYLYIEADEDHIHYQGAEKASHPNGMIGKLVYLYESKETISKGHRKLVNVFYMGGLYYGSGENEKLWKRMQEYICRNYDTSLLRKVYISGDCGAWIKAGTEHIAKSVMVMDKFHMMKYINQAANQMLDEADRAKKHLWKALYKGKPKKFNKWMDKISACAPNTKRVEECRTYFNNHWDAAVLRMQDKQVYGCSAEGHVSHIYSERMSSRPMAWGEKGADQMCGLRCYIADYGEEKIIELVHRRREEKWSQKAAGAEEVIVDEIQVRETIRESHRKNGKYFDRMQSTVPGSTVRKALSIREQIKMI